MPMTSPLLFDFFSPVANIFKMATMASSEDCVLSDPNFAVVCSFLQKFGDLCGVTDFSVDFHHLQHMLEDTRSVHADLVDLHVRLMRKLGRKNVTHDKWEVSLVKYCHCYSKVDAWEIERFGYKKSKLNVKINLLKRLLESQFDRNGKLKSEVNKLTAEQLRTLPIGKDVRGQLYWFQVDDDLNLRVYREDQDEETFELVVRERDDLITLIENLVTNTNLAVKKEEDSTTPSDTGDSKDGEASQDKQDAKIAEESVQLETKAAAKEVVDKKLEESGFSNLTESLNIKQEPKELQDDIKKPEDVPPSSVIRVKEESTVKQEELSVKQEEPSVKEQELCVKKEATEEVIVASTATEACPAILADDVKPETARNEIICAVAPVVEDLSKTCVVEPSEKLDSSEPSPAPTIKSTSVVVPPPRMSVIMLANADKGLARITPDPTLSSLVDSSGSLKPKNVVCETDLVAPSVATTSFIDEAAMDVHKDVSPAASAPPPSASCASSALTVDQPIIQSEPTNSSLLLPAPSPLPLSVVEPQQPPLVPHDEKASPSRNGTAKDRRTTMPFKKRGIIKNLKVTSEEDNGSAVPAVVPPAAISIDSSQRVDQDVAPMTTTNKKVNDDDVVVEREKLRRLEIEEASAQVMEELLKKTETMVALPSPPPPPEPPIQISTIGCASSESSLAKADQVASENISASDESTAAELTTERVVNTDLSENSESQSISQEVHEDKGLVKLDAAPAAEAAKDDAAKEEQQLEEKVKVVQITDDASVAAVEADGKKEPETSSEQPPIKKARGRRRRNAAALLLTAETETTQNDQTDDGCPTGRIQPKRSCRVQAQREKEVVEQRRIEDRLQREAMLVQHRLQEERKRKGPQAEVSASATTASPQAQVATTKPSNGQVKAKKPGRRSKNVKVPVKPTKEEPKTSPKKEAKQAAKGKNKRRRLNKAPQPPPPLPPQQLAATNGRGSKKRKAGYKPWDVSSESSSASSCVEEDDQYGMEEVEESDEELVFSEGSDHEFSPESSDTDRGDDDDYQPAKMKRARTVRRVKSDNEEGSTDESEDDKPCSKCDKYDHPEWILLCDKCDSGFHASCLRPPLLLIPDGDWFCPPCDHKMLVEKLQEQLKNLDQLWKKKEREDLRKKRLAYVGISLDNVLKPEKRETEDDDHDEDGDGDGDEDEDGGGDYLLLRKRSKRARKEVSYRFKEFDELIDSAIQDETNLGAALLALPPPKPPTSAAAPRPALVDSITPKANLDNGDNLATMKTESNEAQKKELKNKSIDKEKKKDYADEEEEEEDELVVVRKTKKKHRRLNDLDSPSDDDDSDEDFKGSLSESDHPSDDDSGAGVEDTDDSWKDSEHGRRRGQNRSRRVGGGARRKSDDDFVCDDSEESIDAPRTVRRAAAKSVNYRELSDSDDGRRRRSKKSPAESWHSTGRRPSRIVSDEGSSSSSSSSDDCDWKKKKKRTGGSVRKLRTIESDDEATPVAIPESRPKAKAKVESEAEEGCSSGRRVRSKSAKSYEEVSDDSDDVKPRATKKPRLDVKNFELDSDDECSKSSEDDEEDDEDDEDEDEEDSEEDEKLSSKKVKETSANEDKAIDKGQSEVEKLALDDNNALSTTTATTTTTTNTSTTTTVTTSTSATYPVRPSSPSSKLTVLDTVTYASNGSTKLTTLEPYNAPQPAPGPPPLPIAHPPPVPPPRISSPSSSGGLQPYDRPSRHRGGPPPQFHPVPPQVPEYGDYPPVGPPPPVGQYYPSPNYPHGPPTHPHQQPPSAHQYGYQQQQQQQYPQYHHHHHSMNYNYGYGAGDQQQQHGPYPQGPPPPSSGLPPPSHYGGNGSPYGNYSSPPPPVQPPHPATAHQQPPPPQQQQSPSSSSPTPSNSSASAPANQPNGRFSIENLLQRRIEGAAAAGEDDEFSTVKDLVSYITGSSSHDTQL